MLIDEIAELTKLPDKGYIIEMPYDENIGSVVYISVIPYTQFDIETIQNNKDRICLVKTRMKDEDDFNFKMRLEHIIDNIRKYNSISN